MYDQLLAKVGMKLADGLVAEGPPLSEDDAQLSVWFREIDVDVVRTCHRSIYENTAPNATSAMSTSADNVIDSTVESILNGMVETIVRSEGENEVSPSTTEIPLDAASTSTCTTHPSTEMSELEAKIRRVLRAYVVYNPRK
ncbi:Hypothetical protein PHPALM_2228 [Phytophthora palmivora]|uniref:Uncharacterized protein n=1 Tax=Phytophthora palmivora TaxID=4796 RepID=A0A2P4YQB1_9STRA|nr:Hypothetical protein PHPALM_2228 [Phytophthora palmivora]